MISACPGCSPRATSEEEKKESQPRNYAWARLIKKVYETSPLVCKQCGNEMKIISIITDYETRKKISKHLGLWNRTIHFPPPRPSLHPPPDMDAIPDIDNSAGRYF